MKAQARGKTYLGKWKSDQAEQAYRALEVAAWDQATDNQPEPIDIETGYGTSRVYRWPGNGPAVVFLHGMGDFSIRWVPYAERLTGFDVYAVDIMGDVGRSKPTVGFTNSTEYADWFGQTMNGLGLDNPHVVGESLGGYIALVYAITSGKAASVVGIDPVGVVDLRLARFTAWGMAMALASFTPTPLRRRLAHRLRHPLLLDKEAMNLYLTGFRGHPMAVPPQPLFTDEELGTITCPVRVLAAAKSSAFDAEALAKRINDNVPDGTAVVLPDAGHSLSMSRFDDCLTAVQGQLTPAG